MTTLTTSSSHWQLVFPATSATASGKLLEWENPSRSEPELVSSTSDGTGGREVFPSASPTLKQALKTDIYYLFSQAIVDGNIIAFNRLVDLIDWTNRSAEEHLWVIEVALEIEAPLVARQLSQAAVARFPDNTELAKYAHVLAPPKTVQSGLPPDPGQAKNSLWLRANRRQYLGRWVALRDGELLAAADSFQEVRQQVGRLKNARILVARVT